MHGVILHPDRMSCYKCYFIIKCIHCGVDKTNGDPEQLASSFGVKKTTVDPDKAS